MKKFIGLFIIVGFILFSVIPVFAFESLTLFQTGPGATIHGSTRYFSTSGLIEGVAQETEHSSSFFGTGEYPKVLIYSAASGAFTQEASFQFSGVLTTKSVTGTTTLSTFIDPNNDQVMQGVLDQRAAGVQFNGIGTGTSQTVTKTAGGLVIQHEMVGEFPSVSLTVGTEQRVTTGSGPVSGAEGERVSSTTEYAKTLYSFGSFGKTVPLSIQWSSSFNKGISLIPVPVVP